MFRVDSDLEMTGRLALLGWQRERSCKPSSLRLKASRYPDRGWIGIARSMRGSDAYLRPVSVSKRVHRQIVRPGSNTDRDAEGGRGAILPGASCRACLDPPIDRQGGADRTAGRRVEDVEQDRRERLEDAGDVRSASRQQDDNGAARDDLVDPREARRCMCCHAMVGCRRMRVVNECVVRTFALRT